MANENGWGDGAVNNNIGWGQGALNNNISWGKSQIDSWSGATDIDGGNAPINTVAPVISGNTSLGSVLTTTNGTWTGAPTITYTYQWKRNGIDISSATNSNYTIVVADSAANITCQITATNSLGSANATSNTITAQTFTAPVNTVAPAITGTAQEGQTLTCSTGTWTGNPTPTYTYQWKRNNSNIGSATNSTYTLVTADVGQSIKCTVTATNAISAVNADSNIVTPTSSTDADAQAFITAASITDPTQQSAINQLVVDLKGYGIWTKFNALYPFVGGTATTHKFNLKNPLDTNAAHRILWSGDVTHSANGVQFGGVNGYGNTNLTANFLPQNSAHMSFYSRTNNTSGGLDMGQNDVASTSYGYLSLYTPSLLKGVITMNNSAPNYLAETTFTNTLGLMIGSRTTSTMVKLFRNTTKTESNSINSTTPQALNIFIGARNDGGTAANYVNKQCAFASAGTGLNDTEAANFYTAVQAFQTTLGRQV